MTTIRHATLDDVGIIVGFMDAMAQETEARSLDRRRLAQGVSHAIGHPADALYLVAEASARIVGSLMVSFEWSDWRAGRFWWIQSVYVLPEYRRAGIYSIMHARVRELAMEDALACGIRLYVERENEIAQATYRRLGMAETYYKLFEEEFPTLPSV